MKKWLMAIILFAFITEACSGAENLSWWGLISYRQRHETYKTYIDITAVDSTTWGDLRQTDDNSKTRLGYKFGFRYEVNQWISASATIRSGVGIVMHQDITNSNKGLFPGLLRAYIDWKPPYGELMLGRIAQDGNAMWDLYAASNDLQDPIRQNAPLDGIFNDKMGFLNGMRVLVPVGPVQLRGTYHTDYVAGFRRVPAGSSAEPAISPQMDQKIYLAGLKLDIGKVMSLSGIDIPEGLKIDINGDYGWPYRIGSYVKSTSSDSVYAEEELYGATLNAGYYSEERKSGAELWIGYGYNWREGVYKSTFMDYKASVEYAGYRLTGKYQYNTEDIKTFLHAGKQAVRRALHLYLNKTLWGLDIQPRYIRFQTEVEGNKWLSNDRYEINTAVRF